MLSSMGVEVVDERPYGLDVVDRVSHIYDFGLRYGEPLPEQARELFSDALRAIWDGYTETDGFNALVLRASLTWRQAMLLRAYAKYMRQGNSPFAIDSIEGALAVNVELARMLVKLFETRFDPDLDDEARDPGAGRPRGPDQECARRGREPRPRPDPPLLPDPHPGDPAHELLPARGRRAAPQALPLAQARAVGDPGPAGAPAEVRDLRLLAAGRGRAPALRRGRPRWPALVGPTRRLPHRDPRPGQGADGQEHGDRARRREGRVLRQAAARSCR